MAPSWQQLLIVLVLVLVLFGGRGRISSLMGDMAQGIKSFRSGLKEDDTDASDAPTSKLTAEQRMDADTTGRTAKTVEPAETKPKV